MLVMCKICCKCLGRISCIGDCRSMGLDPKGVGPCGRKSVITTILYLNKLNEGGGRGGIAGICFFLIL
jgi:hypothetical protein